MEPTTILMVVSAAISVATAIYSANLVGDMDQSDSGASVTKTGTTATKNPVYGKCRISSVNVYNNVSDTNSEDLLSVFSFGIGPMEAVHQIYIDEIEAIAEGSYTTNPSGDETQLEFGGIGNFASQNVRIQIRSGAETEVGLSLAINNSDGEWTLDHRGDRCGQAAVKVRRVIDDEGARILSPTFSLAALVSGLKVYDPRIHQSPSQKAFSRNVALCILDYITDSYYGMGIDLKYIDLQSFIDTANWCDSNSLYIDAEIDSAQAFSETLGKMIACFGGIIVAEDGYIKLLYDDIALPKYAFDEDNIVGDGIRVTNQNSSGYYNVVEASYKNFNMDEKEDIYTLPKSIATDPRIARDGYTKSTKLELPYVIDGRRDDGVPDGAVKFLTNRMYRRSDFQKRVDFDIDLLDYPVKIYDVIEVSNDHYGWDRKLWRVISKNKTIDEEKLNIATISCEEYDDSIYTGSQDGGAGKPLPKPPTLTPPTNLQFNLQTYITSGYGELTWDNTSFGPSNETQIDYKLSSDIGWTRLGRTPYTIWKVANLAADTYSFRVRTYNPAIGTSDWTELNDVVISPNVILPSVTGLTCDTTSSTFEFTWDSMLDSIVAPIGGPDSGGSDGTVGTWFSHYQVDIFHWENGSFAFKKSYNTTSPEYKYTLAENKLNGINRRVRADVYIVAKDSSKSQIGAGSTFDATNQQSAQVQGLDISGKIAMIWTEFSLNEEPDFIGTEIHMSTTSGFTPNASTLVTVLGNETFNVWYFPDGSDASSYRYVRVGHFDVFGNDGIIYSPQVRADYNSIDNEITPFDPTDLQNQINQNKQDILDNGQLIGQNAQDISDNTNQINQNKQTIDDIDDKFSEYIPDVADQLASLRDPNNAPVKTGTTTPISERINIVASANKSQTAGFGLYALNDGTSQMIIAADELIIGGGAGGVNTTVGFYYDSIGNELLLNNATIKELTAASIKAGTITANEIATGTITSNEIKAGTIVASDIAAGTITANEIKAGTITANEIATGTITALEIAANTITSNEIKAGTIQASDIAANTITANEIAASTITAAEIQANTITGNKISSSTTIIAGSGSTQAGMNGSDASGTYQYWRFWAGSSTPSSAPYRVYRDGRLWATNADVTGTIRATSAYLTGTMRVGIGTTTSNYVDILGGGTAGGNDQRFLRVQDGGYERVRWDYDGRLRMSSGSSNVNGTNNVVDFDPVAGTFKFRGNVFADAFVGDVITKRVKAWSAFSADYPGLENIAIPLTTFNTNTKVPYRRSFDWDAGTGLSTGINRGVLLQLASGGTGNRQGNWQLVVMDLTNGTEQTIDSGTYTLDSGTPGKYFGFSVRNFMLNQQPAPNDYITANTSYRIEFRTQGTFDADTLQVRLEAGDGLMEMYRDSQEFS